jgi:hypothetical protein
MKARKAVSRVEGPLPEKDRAVAYANAALDAALLSPRDKQWPERVVKASFALSQALLSSEQARAETGSTKMEKRRLEVEERKVSTLEAREKRERDADEVKYNKKKRGPLTQKDIDDLRMKHFGLPPVAEERARLKLLQEQNAKALAAHAESLRVGRSLLVSESAGAANTAASTSGGGPSPAGGQPVVNSAPPTLPRRVGTGQESSRFPSACSPADTSAFSNQEPERNRPPRFTRYLSLSEQLRGYV